MSTLAASPIPTVICGRSPGTPLGRPGPAWPHRSRSATKEPTVLTLAGGTSATVRSGKENHFCGTDCGSRHPARSPDPAAPRPPGRRQRSVSDAVGRLCSVMSLRVWSASPRAMAATRPAWIWCRRLISCAAEVFAAGRTSKVLCPASGTFGSGQAASVAVARRYEGPCPA